jgi:hypothetical protein
MALGLLDARREAGRDASQQPGEPPPASVPPPPTWAPFMPLRAQPRPTRGHLPGYQQAELHRCSVRVSRLHRVGHSQLPIQHCSGWSTLRFRSVGSPTAMATRANNVRKARGRHRTADRHSHVSGRGVSGLACCLGDAAPSRWAIRTCDPLAMRNGLADTCSKMRTPVVTCTNTAYQSLVVLLGLARD